MLKLRRQKVKGSIKLVRVWGYGMEEGARTWGSGLRVLGLVEADVWNSERE